MRAICIWDGSGHAMAALGKVVPLFRAQAFSHIEIMMLVWPQRDTAMWRDILEQEVLSGDLHRAAAEVSTAYGERLRMAVAPTAASKLLVRKLPEGVMSGRIVETEAYPLGNAAGHAYNGVTPRNRTLFLERGHAYVYVAYGTSFMLNVSSEKIGIGVGVLIRAIEPTAGISIMEHKRGTERLRDLARGPGRLCAAFSIDLTLDGIDLCKQGPLWLASDGRAVGKIGLSKRIGITRAAHRRLRFYVRGNGFVSGPRALTAP